MKYKLLITVLLAAFSSAAFTGHHKESSVEGFVKDYLENFNNMTLKTNPELSFTFPVVFIRDGKVRVVEDASEWVFDISALRDAGWAYSKIINTTVLDEGENSAVVLVYFSRHSADDSIIQTVPVFYTLSMTDQGWKIAGVSNTRRITRVE